jgi:hypothetical protein
MAISAGAGIARGPLRIGDHECSAAFFIISGCDDVGASLYYDWKAAVRRSFELGLERRSENGFQWRIFVGRFAVLNPEDACKPAPGPSTPPPRHCLDERLSGEYLGTSFGYSFGP